MAVKFVVPIDLNGLELLNFLAQKLATAPTHAEGRIYYDTTLAKLRVGVAAGAWETLGESTSGMTTEQVQDIIGGMVSGTGVMSVTYNDAAGTLTISSTATVNATDAALRDRSTHTGTQTSSTISDFSTAVPAAVPAASETVQGKVELATTAEATTGTDTARAVTPAGVKAVGDTKAPLSHTHTAANVTDFSTAADARVNALVPASSETAAGKVELATAAETTTGTDNTRAVHPAGLKVELDKKALLVHTHTASQVTDFTTSVQSLVNAAISALVDSAPGTLDTLNELAAALGDDPNFATTITNGLNLKPDTFAAGVGNGSLTTIPVTHNLGTRSVQVYVYETATPFTQVIPEIRHTDANNVTLVFGTAPTANQYTVVVQG